MARNWLTELTGVSKPIIGMVHLPALPGTPLFDSDGGMKAIREWVSRDLGALQAGGIDAVMFCNENDRPYRLDSDFASVAAMADVVATMRDSLSVPFGVNVLWDPRATLAVAKATGAAFCREIFTGAFAGDFGLWVRSCRRFRPVSPRDRRRERPPAVQHQRRIRRADRAASSGRSGPLGRLLLESRRDLHFRRNHQPGRQCIRPRAGRRRPERHRRTDSGQHRIQGQQCRDLVDPRRRRNRRIQPQSRRHYLEQGRRIAGHGVDGRGSSNPRIAPAKSGRA